MHKIKLLKTHLRLVLVSERREQKTFFGRYGYTDVEDAKKESYRRLQAQFNGI
jgi:hypothetical protein